MTQPTPLTHSQPLSTSPGAAQLFASMPVFKFPAQYIQAAASGDRATRFHLFVAVFTAARAAVRCLAEHYNTHIHRRSFDTYARLKYCIDRLNAIFYTLRHAPERFLTPAQLRALTRARAVLAHIWRQPVDFSPLTPYLTAPENCPPPPRSKSSAGILPASEAPLRTPHSALRTSSSPAHPLLLNSPGRALASVLLQLAAIYGVSPARVSIPRSVPSTPPASPQSDTSPAISKHIPNADLPQSSAETPAGSQPGLSQAISPHFPHSPP